MFPMLTAKTRRPTAPWLRPVFALVVVLGGACMGIAPAHSAPPPGAESGWRQALAASILTAPSTAGQPPTPAPDLALARYARSIVRLEAAILPNARSLPSLGRNRVGSGVLIDSQTVVTIGYLIMEAESVRIQSASGKEVPATVMGYDHATGLGVLRALLPVDGQPLELGDSDEINESHSVLTIGQGENEATPLIVVSRKPFAGSWEYLLEKPIYTFPPVNNWSGSALISREGALIGIGSLIVEDAASVNTGIPGNLFVPVNLLKPILADLKTRGRSTRPAQPWLGVTTQSVRGNLMVVRVAPDSPADQSGIQAGDFLLAVDEEPVVDQLGFYRRLLKKGPAGTTVSLRILHEGVARVVSVVSIDRHDFLIKTPGI